MGFFKKFLAKVTRTSAVTAADWDELYSELIASDLGASLTDAILASAKKSKSEEPLEAIREALSALLSTKSRTLAISETGLTTILVSGVNGTGKTTSLAKLGALLGRGGNSVVMAAADTFRAAAIEQLAAWGEKLHIPVVRGAYQGDPAAVCHDAYETAARDKADFLLCDTAGRLHTKHNLMQELSKVKRVLARRDPESPHEVLIVLDATTGSNALEQAKQFQAACGLTGAILTKLDGSGRGGTAVALQQELGIPVRFVGTGEKETDFAPFDPKKFAAEMF